MQLLDGRFIYSAIDNNFLEYGHLVAVERLVATAALKREKRNCTLILIAAKGIAHEKNYFAALHAKRGDVVVKTTPEQSRAALLDAEASTLSAMNCGAAAIYQGTFFDGTFVGKKFVLKNRARNGRGATRLRIPR